jgi:NitT/TauT family transport system permease protein
VKQTRMQQRFRDASLGLAGFGILAAMWELLKRAGGGKRLFGINTSDSTMPHVTDVVRAFSKEAIRGQGKSVLSVVLNASWFTFRLAVGGFVLGIGLGLLLAMVMQRFRIVERAWLPYVVLSQTVPLIALAPLISGWGGNIRLFGYQWTGWMSVVGMAAYLSFFPITIGALRGFKSPKTHSVELMDSYAASWWQTLIKLRLPASVPYLVPSLKLAAAASVVGSIVSEASIGVSGGIGRLIIDFTSGEPAKVFTAFLGAAVLGLVVAGLVAVAAKFLTRNLNASNQTGAPA